MKNSGYKGKYNNKGLIKLIALFVVAFILFLLAQLLNLFVDKNSNTKVNYNSLSTVKEIIEYYKSTYISEEDSAKENYKLDIYLKLYVLPYDENDNSNEKYYNDLLGDVAKALDYSSYRMLDKENDITIEVICKNDKIISIIINGIEDYFIYKDSQLSMKNYKDIEITNFEITSDIIKNCISNKWKTGINFGSRESIFNEYDIYFDEGIKVRNIQNKIYNIVFTNKYKGNVIENIHPGMDMESIKDILGNPTFYDENIVGYKGENIYAFFSNDEISIYRIPEEIENIKDFLEIVDIYLLDDESDLLEFMNQLTYIWPDYSEYKYDSKYFFIAYPLKGIEIKVNYDDTNGILVYNNIRGNIADIQPYLNSTDFVAKLQLDSVYEAEKRRYKKEIELSDKCDSYLESLDEKNKNIIGESLFYNFYGELDSNNRIYSMKFVSRTGDNPNRELNDGIDTYLWINNDNFVYSKEKKGIYLYNLKNGKVSQIISGDNTFNIVNFKDGKLKFDDKEIEIP